MIHSLRVRLSLAFIAVSALPLAALALSMALFFTNALAEQYVETYRSNAQVTFVAIEEKLRGGLYLRPGGSDFAQQARALATYFHVRLRVFDGTTDGKLLVDTGSPTSPPGQHLTRETFPSLVYPLTIAGVPVARLVVSEPLTDRQSQSQRLTSIILWIALVAVVLACLMSGILAERLSAPLRLVTQATTRIDVENLHERVPEGWSDELGVLARQFNRMAARLEESFMLLAAERDRLAADRDRLRHFVGDVSHELRTPLTALRTFNDLLREGAGERPDTRDDFLAESARQIERLDWLTRNLLDLSRLEAGLTALSSQPVDVMATLRRAVETNRPGALAKQITLHVDDLSIVVPHDPPRMEQVFSNIVNNAIKFSPRGGHVAAHGRMTERFAVIDVCDEGPGIAPDDMPHIFDRFYRGQLANRAGEGSGLGLAIAKAVIDAHHGIITVARAPDGGAALRVMLPLERTDGVGEECCPTSVPAGDGAMQAVPAGRRA